MSPEIVIDASLFMGMHSTDDLTRVRCKGFFAQRIEGAVVMSLEHVGRCDDLVWSYPRDVQDRYYPFMDVLHTDMDIRRIGYGEKELITALEDPVLAGLPMHERLLLAMVLRRDAVLYTVSPRLRAREDLPVHHIDLPSTSDFPDGLEQLYQESLVLRVGEKDL
ncbi:hypothetical protein D5S17_04850 [Pseudonocardiaceae bacterium YIM PH 21723]|nr:hypothetical protein D5S17_04850 [Pseudonocardiaceae bacterium YIM PH 21723]